MTNSIELARQVIIVCTMIANNNYNKPTVNVDSIISCNNMYNEPLIINKKKEINTDNIESKNVYIINNSDINIEEIK